jgi:hypothetical protein
MRGASVGPMGSKEMCGEVDLGPRRVGIHFRKLACRSDAVDEVLTDSGSTVWTSAPAHDRQALLMNQTEPGRSWPSSFPARLRRSVDSHREVVGLSRFSGLSPRRSAGQTRRTMLMAAVQQGDEADKA